MVLYFTMISDGGNWDAGREGRIFLYSTVENNNYKWVFTYNESRTIDKCPIIFVTLLE